MNPMPPPLKHADCERLQQLINAIGDGVWDWDRVADRIDWDARSYALLGYAPDAFPLNLATWKTLIHPEDRATAWEMVATQLRSGQRFSVEFRYQRADGGWIWVQGRGQVVSRNEQGEATRLLGTHTDISAHRAIIQQLAEERLLLRSLYAAIPDLVWLKDLHGRFLVCNPAVTAYYGAPAEEILGRCDADFVSAETAAAYRRKDQHVAATGVPHRYEQWMQHADGRPRRVEVTKVPLRRDDGSLLGVLGVARDISDRHATEERLRQLSLAVEQSPVSIVVTDLDARIQYVNPCFSRITGYSAAEVLNQNPRILQSGVTRPETYQALWDTVTAGKTWSGLLHNRRKDGSLYWEQAIISPIRDNEGRIVQYLGVKQDITLQKQLEDALARSEARYRTLFESARVAMLLIDPNDGCIIEANAAACAYYGYSAAQMRALHIGDINTLSAEQLRTEMACAQLDNRYQFFFRHRLANGQLRDVEVHSGPIEFNGRSLLYSIIHDITERRAAEQRLRLMASVFRHAHDGIVITDAAVNIIEVNETFTTLTGYSRDEVLGRNPRLLQSGHHERAFYAGMWQALNSDGFWTGEMWNRKKNGEIYAEIASISAVRDDQGQVTHYVNVFADITALKHSQQRLERLAFHDPLTGLPNRALLSDRLSQAIANAERSASLLAVGYLDLDGFKPVNDRLGHAAGDQLLIAVARRLGAELRSSDTLSRLGGDEFVLLLNDLGDLNACERALYRILAALAAPFTIAGQQVTVSASLGVSLYPLDHVDADTLIRHADQAMYAAKQAGRNRYRLFDRERDQQVQQQSTLLGQLAAALQQNALVLHYQPQVDLRRGTVTGVEALLRWPCPERGLLLADEFLPGIEHSDLMISLGEWVLETALRQLDAWAALGQALPLSVNIAARHLRQPDFIARLRALLARYPAVQPQWLVLELRESAALDQLAQMIEIIGACQRLGVRVALDDFGTAHSSLHYFRRLSANDIKIDRSLIGSMLDETEDLAIIEAIIGLTETFQRQVIAKGVEQVEQGALLLQLGCDQAQGFIIAPAMPGSQVPVWRAGWRPDPRWCALATHYWPRADFPLLALGIEHRRWAQRIRRALTHEEDVPTLTSILTRHSSEHGDCFMHWLERRGRAYRQRPELALLLDTHSRFHAIADQIIQRQRHGDHAGAAQELALLDKELTVLLAAAERVQHIVALPESAR